MPLIEYVIPDAITLNPNPNIFGGLSFLIFNPIPTLICLLYFYGHQNIFKAELIFHYVTIEHLDF